MMNKLIALILGLLLLSCAEDKETKNNVETNFKKQIKSKSVECPEYLMDRKSNNLNITILVDLSSRIDQPYQQSKDSAYIVSIANIFNNHIVNKKLGLLKDKMQLLFHPTPNNSLINNLSQKLQITYEKGVSKKEWIGKTTSLYQEVPSQIYELAREDFQKSKKYPGADIWRFFEDDIKDYAIDECYRNIVVILTDGYMFFENTKIIEKNRTTYLTPKFLNGLPLKNANWKKIFEEKDYGFKVANQDLEEVEVLVLGIQSLNTENSYAPDIIEEYWNKWFREMGIVKSKVKQSDIPSSIEKVINAFIVNE
jgi:hypothetical protein